MLRLAVIYLLSVLVAPASANPLSFLNRSNGTWKVEDSSLTYVISHPLHACEGQSKKLSGSATCADNHCKLDFQIETKSFVSKDPDKDKDMALAMKALSYPVVTLAGEATIQGEEVELRPSVSVAGKTLKLPLQKMKIKQEWATVQLTGELPWKLSDFDVIRPRLLGIQVEDLVKVNLDIILKKQ